MVTWKPSPNFTPQSGVKKRHITLHWMVGTLASTDAVFLRKGSGASAHYGIEGNRVHQYVEESQYAWADGNTHSNKYGISIEHAGGWLLPGGGRAHPSPETHEASAQLCADISRRHGLGTLVVGVNIFPHNHWVATQCPGSLDIHLIAERANELLNGTTEPKRRKKRTMLALLINDSPKKLGGGIRTYITGPGYWLETTGHPTANEVSVLVQGHAPDGKVNDVPNLTYKELYDYARASGGCPPGELVKIAAAAGVTVKPPMASMPGGAFTAADRERLEAVPTAEQNGQAARSAIVKAWRV